MQSDAAHFLMPLDICDEASAWLIAQAILPRLKERSTYVGIVGLLTAFGIAIDPAYVDVALALGAGIGGVIAIVWKDKPAA